MPDIKKLEDRAQAELDLIMARAEKTLARSYLSALKDVKSQLADLNELYAVNGELSFAELARYNQLSAVLSSIDRITTDLEG